MDKYTASGKLWKCMEMHIYIYIYLKCREMDMKNKHMWKCVGHFLKQNLRS